MKLIKQDIYVEDIENGKWWAEDTYEDMTKGIWLKPLKEVYVLTEDELEEITKNIIRNSGTFLKEDLTHDFLKTISKFSK